MSVTYRSKLLASHVAVVVVAMLLAIALLDRFVAAELERQVDDRLERQAVGASQWIGEGGYPRTNQLARRIASIVGADVSIFDREGTLLGDSRDGLREPVVRVYAEIIAARRSGIGRATRAPDIGEGDHRYLAVATDQGYILRLSAPLADAEATIGGMRRRLFVGAAIAVLVALALAVVASRFAAGPLVAMTRVATRIAGGDYRAHVPPSAPDEFGQLAGALGGMAKQLEERTTMRRDYLANISHELRTPVTAIQGYAETLLDQPLDVARERRFVEIIHHQALRIGGLVEELVMLGDLEARPTQGARLERVEIAAVASSVLETLEAQITAAGARIVLDESIRGAVLAEPEGLERIVQNLVENALRYGRKGGSIRISAIHRRSTIAIEVTDDGPGIAAEHLPRLFERFYRVDPSRSRERGGAGLGLAIVKHYAELMGGRVSVRSEVGHGASFSVELCAAPEVTT
jgi:signal transduction histidine kinase